MTIVLNNELNPNASLEIGFAEFNERYLKPTAIKKQQLQIKTIFDKKRIR